MHEMRKKIWIDRFQTHLSLMFAVYALVYQAIVFVLIFCWRTLTAAIESITGTEVSWLFYATVPVFLILVAVYFIYDGVKYTHRIVGPLYRFRQTIKAILAGEPVDVVRLRKGDYLGEMRDDLNELLELLEQRGIIEVKRPAPAASPKQATAV